MKKKNLKDISIILISYKSSTKLIKFLKKIPKDTPVLVIDNSKDYKLKKLFKKIKMFQFFLKKIWGMDLQLIML